MRIYGYFRVSTKDQNLDRQLIELKSMLMIDLFLQKNKVVKILTDLNTNYLEKLHNLEILYILNH